MALSIVDHARRASQLLLGLLFVTVVTLAAANAAETVLYRFKGGNDGNYPFAGLLMDSSGALYGTTMEGGAGSGTVFKLIPPESPATAWTKIVLHRFDGTDGARPSSRLIRDASGALYGTTFQGGADCSLGRGCGTVFKLTPPTAPATTWTRTVLYRFVETDKSGEPQGELVLDRNGALYGTTYEFYCCGNGTVFKLTPPGPSGGDWTKSVIYRFKGGRDGATLPAGLIIGEDGALFGTTQDEGDFDHGTVFKLTPRADPAAKWIKTVLYRFKGRKDGKAPYAKLVAGEDGVLYGTTSSGGIELNGTVFKLSPPTPLSSKWTFTVLHRFKGGQDGSQPYSELAIDRQGSLYGTTSFGGAGWGTVFKLTPPATSSASWTRTILHRFQGGKDGAEPYAGLILDENGVLYGTTFRGGRLCQNGCGTVFKVQ